MTRVQIAIAAWTLLLSAGALGQEAPPLPEGNAYVRGLVKEQHAQDDAISAFAYDLEEARQNLNKKGEVTSTETLRYQVHFVKTRPIRRLVSRNGVALSAKEQAAVDRKAEELSRDIRAGRTVSEQTGVRLSRLFASFDFVTLGRVEVGGRSGIELRFEPRKDHPKETEAIGIGDRMLKMLGGEVVIDEEDKRVVRLEARSDQNLSASVSFGIKLNTIDFKVEFVSLGKGVWLPAKVETLAAGRAFLFKTFRVRQTSTYSNYRRFSVDANETPAQAASGRPGLESRAKPIIL